jgi:hypothetical protein
MDLFGKKRQKLLDEIDQCKRAEKYYEALRLCDEILKDDPNDYDTLKHKVRSLQGIEKYEKKLEHLVELYEDELKCLTELHEQELKRPARTMFEGLAHAATKQYIEDVLIKLGDTLFALGRYDESLARYKERSDISKIVETLSKLGRHDELMVFYDEKLKASPQSIEILRLKAELLNKLGMHDEAVACYEKIASSHVLSAAEHGIRGDALFMLGRYEEAIPFYEKAGLVKNTMTCCDKVLEINPNNTYVLHRKIYILRGRKLYDRVITVCDDILKIDPKDVDALYNKGFAFDKLGKHKDAITWYDKVLKIDPKHVNALNNRGVAILRVGTMPRGF